MELWRTATIEQKLCLKSNLEWGEIIKAKKSIGEWLEVYRAFICDGDYKMNKSDNSMVSCFGEISEFKDFLYFIAKKGNKDRKYGLPIKN